MQGAFREPLTVPHFLYSCFIPFLSVSIPSVIALKRHDTTHCIDSITKIFMFLLVSLLLSLPLSSCPFSILDACAFLVRLLLDEEGCKLYAGMALLFLCLGYESVIDILVRSAWNG
jgi:hypothetical protein